MQLEERKSKTPHNSGRTSLLISLPKNYLRASDINSVSPSPKISLVSIADLTPHAKKTFIVSLGQSMDPAVPFGSANNGTELLEVFSEKLGYWVITADNVPVGIFGVDVCRQLPQRWQTSSFMLREHRGNQIGPLTKLAAVHVFQQYGIPLVCLVRDSNKPSLRSLERTFPELSHRDFLYIDNVQFHVFDLFMAITRPVPLEAENVSFVLDNWLRSQADSN